MPARHWHTGHCIPAPVHLQNNGAARGGRHACSGAAWTGCCRVCKQPHVASVARCR